jgi:hypothetical protein
MTAAPDMGAAVAELGRVMNELQAIPRRTDDRRSHDLVFWRRKLAEQMQAMALAAESWPPFQAERSVMDAFRQRFSAFRSALALHQAAFPAVTLDAESAAYAASVARVRDTSEEFMSWMQAHLASVSSR